MEVVDVDSTDLFVGTEKDPRQVVRIRVRGIGGGTDTPGRLRVSGARVRTLGDLAIGPLAAGEEARVEVGVITDGTTARGDKLAAEVILEAGDASSRFPFEVVVAEPGWRMWMISHFHYDPVWWNTQAAYTEAWGAAIQYRTPFQEPGLALVKSHLEMARRDPDYKFVLAELDYLKPYWDVYPEDRAYMRQLMADGRLELMGGTYNEPNTNLTSAESTIRNAIYGIGYQRDVLGGDPATAWQLDAFGHDPQFPGIMADAGVTSSSWARGPFHEWGPHWIRGPGRMPIADMAAGGAPRMQFSTEFDWVAPSGRALLTSFMANHYSAGWWMDSAATLEQAEAEVHLLFTELAALATTKNVLLPVGTDYTPPNKWLTAIHRDWNRRYVWPKFVAAIPREFFDAVREERSRTGRGFTPQTRDMNPVYTGKDVSFIDTKQAQRIAENTLLSAEKFGTVAALLGGRYPSEAIDKAWRQLLFGAHHDGITGSESDQVYLDLLGGWREALELGRSVLDASIERIGESIETAGEGRAITVFNPLSWPRSDVVRVSIDPDADGSGLEIVDDDGASIPFLTEGVGAQATVVFLARDIPALGYRTFRAISTDNQARAETWRRIDRTSIENDNYTVRVDAERGGAIVSIVDRAAGKELIRPGEAANELRAYREYPNHPLFGEGPWHLTPDGRFSSAAVEDVDVVAEECPIGRRLRIEAQFEDCVRRQEIVLWDGLDRVEMTTTIDQYSGQDRLFRVRFPVSVKGGRPIFETGNAVVGRPFGTPNVDVAKVPFTLDNPAYNWFGFGSTAQVELVEPEATEAAGPHASTALGVGEIVVPDEPALDDAVRRLAIALVRQGITSTVSSAGGSRYGVLHIDSNLPDFRLAVGGPDDNAFVDEVLTAAGDGYRTELTQQLDTRGWARLWVPSQGRESDVVEALTDLRGPLALPILIVAGRDVGALENAIASLAEDLEDSRIRVEQPSSLGVANGTVEDYTVALLNRGTPGSTVDESGDLYISLMRSCSGWPSGVWIDPPRRAAPDGSNFQFQHWTHTFDYALVSGAGDWRSNRIVEAGHEYNNPLFARVWSGHVGALPASTSFLEVHPSSAVVTTMKPAGNPMAGGAGPDVDPRAGIVVRVYESAGRHMTANVATAWPVTSAELTNATEKTSSSVPLTGKAASLPIQPFEIATVRMAVEGPEAGAPSTPLGPRSEAAQPVYSQYWMHNKGAAPLGYQPVTVEVRPRFVRGQGPYGIQVVVASERTDEPAPGTVEVTVPPGWQASPPGRLYRLAPGAHLVLDTLVTPAAGAASGRYFVGARITDEAGQVHEDVLTVDHDRTSGRVNGDGAGANAKAPRAETASLAAAMSRAMQTAGIDDLSDGHEDLSPEVELGGELDVELATRHVDVTVGETATIQVQLRNRAKAEIRGEAQLLSPHEVWRAITPWTQGFAVGPGEVTTLSYAVEPMRDIRVGTYWALVKLMYFGRLCYTDSLEVRIGSSVATEHAPEVQTGAEAQVAAARTA